MAKVTVDGANLTVTIEGLHKLFALKSRITVPLTHVRGATADPGIAAEPKGFRAPGTNMPGVISAGTWHKDGQRQFWDVRHAKDAVVIELTGEKYTRLILSVDDPRATVDLINRVLS